MSIIAKEERKINKFAQIEEGVYIARCVSVIDIGTQINEKFGRTMQEIIIQWEIPTEKLEIKGEEVTRILSQEYNLSLHQKSKLRKHLESWRGKSFSQEELEGFDLNNLLNKCCQIQIIHNKKGDNVYANIAGIMPVQRGSIIEKTQRPLIFYDWEDESKDQLYNGLPDWIKKKILKSLEMQGIV
jgi:hypothetical protein